MNATKRALCSLFVGLLLTGTVGQACNAQQTNDKSPDLIFLLIGQSNMAGRAHLAAEDKQPLPRVMLLNDKNSWIPATNPLNRFASDRKKLSMQRVGPGDGFARRLTKALPNKQIGLIVNARGGSSINAWAKGMALYDNTIKRLQANKNIQLAGVIWHQGESDRDDPKYQEKLAMLIQNLRSDTKAPQLPFIAGQIYAEAPVNSVFANLSKQVPHTGFASSKGLTVFDKVHFDRKSQQILGARYAEAYLRLTTQKAP